MVKLKNILDKNTTIYWNTKSTKLNDLAYKLYLTNNYYRNKKLYEDGKDYRSAYATYSDFLELMTRIDYHNEFLKRAKILIRKDKISKIMSYEN